LHLQQHSAMGCMTQFASHGNSKIHHEATPWIHLYQLWEGYHLYEITRTLLHEHHVTSSTLGKLLSIQHELQTLEHTYFYNTKT